MRRGEAGMEFAVCDPHTVGVELEFQLLDAASLDLTDRALSVLDACGGDRHVKPEFIQNTVEVISAAHTDLAALEGELRRRVAELLHRCEALGIRLCGGGTHPFSERLALVMPLPRYRLQVERSGYLAQRQITFATQVHLGMSSGAEAIEQMQAFRPYLPVFIALSAASPFWHGYDTGYACFRRCILAASRSYGVPPEFSDYPAFLRIYEASRRAGIISGFRDLHWDLRVRPDFGTLELRCFDAQPTVSRAVELAGLARAFSHHLRSAKDAAAGGPLHKVHGWLEQHNVHESARLGMDAAMVIDDTGTVRPMFEIAQALLEWLAPTAAMLGQKGYCERLAGWLRGGQSYLCQWESYEREGSLHAVVEELANGLRDDVLVA